MLRAFGASLEQQVCASGMHRVRLRGKQSLEGQRVSVPGDFSSAAFWIAAALLLPGSDLLIEHVGVNPTRTGLLEALAQGGVHLEWSAVDEQAGEPTATLRVRPQPLSAMHISGALVPSLIDEVPILALLATQAHGTTEIRDAAELRVKNPTASRPSPPNCAKWAHRLNPCPTGCACKDRPRCTARKSTATATTVSR
jgi:3-phosphoshikimate 1-carboxyvinyltransferase